MHKEQMVGMAVRLFAVFLVVNVVRYASGLIPYLADSATNKLSITFLSLAVIFSILTAALLWLFPLTIASKLIPDVKNTEPSKTLESGEIELVAFSILGLWVLASAIPDIFYWATFVYLINNAEIGRVQLSPENMGNIVVTTIELVIGFWLLFGSKGIVSLVRRLRNAGS